MRRKKVPDRVDQQAEASDHAQINQSGRDQYIHNYSHATGPAPKALAALPAAPAHLVGRDTELRTVLDLLDPSSPETPTPQVVALSGLPGVGKTALALSAAHRAVAAGWFPGGALFVALRGYAPAGYVSGEQAVGALLRALGVRDADLPPTPDEQGCLYRSEMARRADEKGPVLLVADDAATAAQILPLLPTGGRHRLLLTSRHTLATVQARQIMLATLDPGQAADLITDTLTRAHPDDPRPGGEPHALADVAAHCGCLPLALEIAAALLVADPGLPLNELAAKLTDRPTRLDALHYQENGHSKTVRAAFDLSYKRLPPEQARAFLLLSLNPGPDLSTQAADALTGRPARPLLAALAQASLISEDPVGAGRWRMHDLLRLHATQLSQRLRSPEREKAIDRLLEHYLAATEAADAHLRALPGAPVPDRFHDADDALAWLDTERPGLVAAVTLAATTGRPRTALSLAARLAVFLHRHRHLDDAITIGEHALNAARQVGDRRGEGAAVSSLALALREMRRSEEAVTAYTQAAAIFVEVGDRQGEAEAVSSLGLALQEVRRAEEAITAYTRAAVVFLETGNLHGQAAALKHFDLALDEASRIHKMIAAYTQAAILPEDGYRHGEAQEPDRGMAGAWMERRGRVRRLWCALLGKRTTR